MFRKLQKTVKYVTNVTNVQRIIISYMLIPQITNKYYFLNSYVTGRKLSEK